jgi:hypothetical protein
VGVAKGRGTGVADTRARTDRQDIAEVFDLEATVAVAPELAHLGLAFEG